MWIPIEMAAVDATDEEEFRLWEPKPLQLKVHAFGKYAKDQSLELDGTIVKKYFLPKQVSGLWQMLKGKKKKSPKPMQAAWDQIKTSKVRSGKDEAKNKVMVAAVFGGDDVLCNQEATPRWIDLIMTFSIKYAEVHTTDKGGSWLSLGELEQKVGACEANRKIDEGKYEVEEDSDGEPMYRLKRKADTVTKTLTVSKELTGKKNVSRGAADDVASMLMDMLKGGGHSLGGQAAAAEAKAMPCSSKHGHCSNVQELRLELVMRRWQNVSWRWRTPRRANMGAKAKTRRRKRHRRQRRGS